MGLRRENTNWWCAICGEKNDWKQPNRLLVVQTGEIVNQAKVFEAHAVLQGLCGNLINVLKLLANQQEDGDGLIQNIVTNLCEGSRKGLTEGLRKFTQVDNHHALEVGDEVTHGADEVGTWKSYINVDHIAKERWGPPLVDADWHAFCQAFFFLVLKEKSGQSCMILSKK